MLLERRPDVLVASVVGDGGHVRVEVGAPLPALAVPADQGDGRPDELAVLVVRRADVTARVLDGAQQVARDLGALGRARPDGVAQRPHGIEIGELVRSPDSHFHAAECGTGGCRYGRFVDPEWHREGQDPDYRFSLANERTFLAWVRTALALLAGSVAIVQLADDLGTGWIRKVVGTALGLTGLAVAGLAYQRWRANEQAMRAGLPLPYTPVLAILGGVLTVVAAVVVLLVLFG